MKVERILVPVDFSPHSEAALGYAAHLAERLGASVQAYHVWEPPSPWLPSEVEEVAHSVRLKDALERMVGRRKPELGRKLDVWVEPLRRRALRVSKRVTVGSAELAILQEAREGRFDLVVMGTHGRKGVARLLMGSVAETIVREAPCPVVTVRGWGLAASSAA